MQRIAPVKVTPPCAWLFPVGGNACLHSSSPVSRPPGAGQWQRIAVRHVFLRAMLLLHLPPLFCWRICSVSGCMNAVRLHGHPCADQLQRSVAIPQVDSVHHRHQFAAVRPQGIEIQFALLDAAVLQVKQYHARLCILVARSVDRLESSQRALGEQSGVSSGPAHGRGDRA